MRNQERPISIRVSAEDGENTDHDLLKALYIFKRLRTLGLSRSTVLRNLKKIKAHRQFRQLAQKETPRMGFLMDIANEHDVQLHFWDQARFGKTPTKIHTVIPDHNMQVVNIVAPYFNEPNDFSLCELHLILDLDKFRRKISHETQGNFWQCVEMSDLVGCEEWGQLPHYWRSDNVDLTHEPRFIAFFNFGFTIYMTKRGERGRHLCFHRIHKTRQPDHQKYISLEYIGSDWPENKTLITLEDQFILRSKDHFKVFSCPNDYCDYNTNRSNNLDRHIKSCTQDTVIEYRQTVLTDNYVRERCVEKGAFPNSFHPEHFVTFDIESVGSPSEVVISENTKLHSLQRAVSVSITRTFGNADNRTTVIVRRSMELNDYRIFIQDFMTHLMKLQEELQLVLPGTIRPKLDELYMSLAEFKEGIRNYSFNQVKQIREEIHYLESICKLYVFGFNSQAYDLTVLFSGILYFVNQRRLPLNIIKRGNHIMSLRVDQVVFADCLNFTSGCSLDAFGKMWGAEITKAIFPYEKYETIEDIKEDRYWPRMKDFNSSLRTSNQTYSIEKIRQIFEFAVQELYTDEFMFVFMVKPIEDVQSLEDLVSQKFPVCLETYVQMWVFYTKNVNDRKMETMLDYLKFYNKIDTELLASAFKNYVKSFVSNFKLSPIGFISLPSLAERVLWNMYDVEKNKPYSFPEKYGFVNRILRNSLARGLSCVFKRHVEISSTDEKFDRCVNRAVNGDQFTKLVAYDANSKF